MSKISIRAEVSLVPTPVGGFCWKAKTPQTMVASPIKPWVYSVMPLPEWQSTVESFYVDSVQAVSTIVGGDTYIDAKLSQVLLAIAESICRMLPVGERHRSVEVYIDGGMSVTYAGGL